MNLIEVSRKWPWRYQSARSSMISIMSASANLPSPLIVRMAAPGPTIVNVPEDRVIIWDSPLAGALAQRRAPTRIGFFFPLVNARSAAAAPIAPGPVQQRIRAEYLAGLDDPRTRFVAVTRDALSGEEPSPRKSIPALFPEFGQVLADSWSPVDSAGDYLVFARRAP